MSVDQIEPIRLKARFDAGDLLVVLDVREGFERDIARISLPSNVEEITIPMRDIPGRFDELADLARGRPVVVYCHHGQRSMVAAQWLDARGLSGLVNLEGGIDLWAVQVDPSTPTY